MSRFSIRTTFFLICVKCTREQCVYCEAYYADITINSYEVTVAQGLRRLTRNQIPSESGGSNPTSCDRFLSLT